ncbi:RNA-directed DNA polymerase, eukaryota, reverse transcriptase zinc-binding domain protein [Tanacetum coccineum]
MSRRTTKDLPKAILYTERLLLPVLRTKTYKIKTIQKESIQIESHKSSIEHHIVNDLVVINILEEDVEPKQIILDPDDQPMWKSSKTVALTPNSVIVQPNVDDNFVINSTHLNMIRENKFDGYLRAIPYDHIREFLAICNMFRYGKTQSEAVKLMIFPLSLCDEAKTWFNELNEESITSWEQMRKAFINRFFPPSLFKHEPTQAILDVTAGGIFLYKSPNQAFQLLKDKAMDSQIISLNEELQDMRDKYNELRKGNTSKNHLNDDTPMCERHEVNSIQSEDYQNQNSHDSFSHQSLHDPNDSEKSLTVNGTGGDRLGDFKMRVRSRNKEYGSLFHAHGADAFNRFILQANLQEIPLGGCSFTWCHRSAKKMSKLDRFLMSEGLLGVNPNFSALTLDRYKVVPYYILRQKKNELEVNFVQRLKGAVSWDCGIDKSPGPDGVTFGFIRRYWSLIEKDVVAAVQHFFTSGNFPKGCNASFIALIPKIPDAKLVKDFRPISLIGSLYKIIAKILANRLVGVLGDLVSEVQSAFVADRQILDGPLILNEVLQWCKAKKKQTFIFKIDFEKAYDSVRWDFLGDVFKSFWALGAKCMFNKCFERASGLSINLSKSKLMGLAVSIEKVEEVTRHIGCGILNTPFSFLGSKVGGCMSRIKSWDEVIDKMVNRLSKWKMKTLSIGGRLTLLKAVFGSMPIYHMSIFKVPMLVLQRMESIRCHFFNGNDLDSKRSIWVSWNKVLLDVKGDGKKRGLGVSSLFALNRALMFKWVWRFFNQSDSLWVRVIHAIHGVDGRIGRAGNVGHTSIWCDIIKEMDRLASHGIDLISMMHKKIGTMGQIFFFGRSVRRGEQRLKEVFPRIYALEFGGSDVKFHRRIGGRGDLNGSGKFSVASARDGI